MAPTTCSSVDFPEPEGPVTARMPPGSSANETESRAVIVRVPAWNFFVTPRSSTLKPPTGGNVPCRNALCQCRIAAMPIQHAVLALLASGESHGYEIKTSFEETVGPQWGELNIGHVYQVLDRCVRDGLVTRRHVTQASRPDKTVYRLTPAGERELERWRRARGRRLRMSPRRAVAAAVVPLLAGCGSYHARHARQAHVAAVTLLPDLVERPPAAVIGGVVRVGGREHYSVGFDTTVVNRGRGIMLIQGHRLRGQQVMVADQLIDRVEAPPLLVKRVGWLRYYPHGHHHWHLLPFELYQLRSADGRRVLLHGRKEGFLIRPNGTALRPSRTPPNACGMHRPNALQVGESLEPGQADTYPAYIEGQSLPLDGIRAGRYYIVIWLNRERRPRGGNYANDAGSTPVGITSPAGPAQRRGPPT